MAADRKPKEKAISRREPEKPTAKSARTKPAGPRRLRPAEVQVNRENRMLERLYV
jgi:hypothetical protein